MITSLSKLERRAVTVALLATLLIQFAGCATYQVGQQGLYRPDIRTVHVPMIQSDSARRNLGERLTEALVKEIELKSPFKVTDAASADSVLTARLVSDGKKVLAETAFDDVRDIETDFFVQVSWVDRRGDLIMNHNDIPLPPILLNVSQAANFLPEAGQSLSSAQQEAFRRLAKQIVGLMENGW